MEHVIPILINLKQIQKCIQGIPKDMLQPVKTSFPSQMQECT